MVKRRLQRFDLVKLNVEHSHC